MASSIELQHLVRGGDLKPQAPWAVKHVETVAGITFVEIDVRDTGICRFITGKCKMPEVTWFDELKGLRNRAVTGLLDDNPLFGRQSCSKHEEKKARRQVTADGMDDDEPYV